MTAMICMSAAFDAELAHNGHVKMGAFANQQQECSHTVCTTKLTPKQSI